MKRIPTILGLLAMSLLVGCGSGVQFIPEHDVTYPPRDNDATVELFTGSINRPHVVIGTLTAEERMKASFTDRSTYDSVVTSLKNKARELGADALINAHPLSDPKSSAGTKLAVMAQAVRYMEPEVTLRSKPAEQ